MTPWYSYQLGGWQIAVDATGQHDAAQHIKRNAPGAEYHGKMNPPSMLNPSTATAMTTPARQEEISARYQKWME